MAHYLDPSQYNFVFGGVEAKGFSESNMAKFEFEGQSFDDVAGVDGEVTRTKNMDRRGTLTIYLMESSPTNDLFSAFYAAGRIGVNGADVAAARIENSNGRLVIGAAEAWIADTPKPTWGKSAAEYEWVIRLANADAFFGGV